MGLIKIKRDAMILKMRQFKIESGQISSMVYTINNVLMLLNFDIILYYIKG